jgi:hypothetical protein
MSTDVETPRGRIAANVSAELRRNRLIIKDMGGLNGRSYSYWQRRTSGEIPFAAEELVVVAEFLGVSVMTLLQGVVEPGKSRPSHLTGVTRGYHLLPDSFALAA